ncbi:MAG: diaminopimelate decarboxylase [Bacillota bacterium]
MKLLGTMQINQQGHLEIGGCDTATLAKDFGTPLYIMDEELIRQTCRQYYQAFTQKYKKADVIYASKAFLTLAMARIIEEEGLGLDVVSGGELYTALQAGFPTSRIYFHGNNKSIEELTMALETKVGQIVVDNEYELLMLNDLAGQRGVQPNILLRITPGIEAHTHDYIKTGQIDSKFGFTLPNGQAMAMVKKAIALPNLHLKGLHCHIGSQIFEMDSYAHAARVMINLINEVFRETGALMAELNLGGGFGIYYNTGDAPSTIDCYADIVMEAIREQSEKHQIPVPRVVVEPGRSVIGQAGTTLYTIGSVKNIPGVRKYVAVDGGMTDNIRPALYQASYEALVANKANVSAAEVVSITGKCCESGDMLIWDISLPPVEPGDLLAISCTGAYGYTMSSNYNRIGRPAVVLVANGQADLILRRENYQDLVRNDVVPDRLRKKKVVSLASLG